MGDASSTLELAGRFATRFRSEHRQSSKNDTLSENLGATANKLLCADPRYAWMNCQRAGVLDKPGRSNEGNRHPRQSVQIRHG